jgi:hypothetical protein
LRFEESTGKFMRTLTPLSHCTEVCGLEPKELIVGAQPGPEHKRLAARYRLGPRKSEAVREAIVADIRAALKRNAFLRAADLLVALRLTLADGARRNNRKRPRRRSMCESRRPLAKLPFACATAPAREGARIYSIAVFRRQREPRA